MKESTGKIWGWLIRKLRTIFIAGVVVVVPIGITVWVLLWVFNGIERLLAPVVLWTFGRPITGVGFGITIVLLLVVGAVATNVIGRRIVRRLEAFLGKIPIASRLYVAIKEIFQSFTNPEKTGFMGVVLVEWPIEGMKTVGFITNEETDKNGEKFYNVFIPTAPNPTSGFMEIVRAKDIVRTKLSVEEGLKMVVSGGRITPPSLGDNIIGAEAEESLRKKKRHQGGM